MPSEKAKLPTKVSDLDKETLGVLCHLISAEKLRAMRMVARAQRGDKDAQREAVEFFTDCDAESARRYFKQLEDAHRVVDKLYHTKDF